MFWLSLVSKFIKAMRAGDTPAQIAGGFSIGFLIGLMPFWTLQGLCLFIVLFLFSFNLAAGTLAILLSGLIAFLVDPLFHRLGYFVLTQISVLHGLWETLYNLPVAPLSRFNNTVVMGSFLAGIASFPLVYWGMKKVVVLYRTGVDARIKKWKIVQAIKSSKIVQLYLRLRDLGGA